MVFSNGSRGRKYIKSVSLIMEKNMEKINRGEQNMVEQNILQDTIPLK